MAATFPSGLVALLAVSVLIYFGAAQRVLDRMRLSDKAALILIGAVIVGSFIDIPLGQRVELNVGGTIFIGLALWLIVTAGTGFERFRAVLAALVTAAALYLLTRVLGANPEDIVLDPLYIYPIVAAICGYLAGRSRRSAFVAAVLGVFSLDIGRYLFLLRTGTEATVRVGGAGFFDALVLSGILAVVIAELVGEVLERAQGGPRVEGRDPELLKHLQKPRPEASGHALAMEAGQLPAAAPAAVPPPEEPEEQHDADYDVLLNDRDEGAEAEGSDPPLMINRCNARAQAQLRDGAGPVNGPVNEYNVQKVMPVSDHAEMVDEWNVQRVTPLSDDSGLINECNVQKETAVEVEAQEQEE